MKGTQLEPFAQIATAPCAITATLVAGSAQRMVPWLTLGACTLVRRCKSALLLALLASTAGTNAQTLVTSPTTGSSGVFYDTIGYSFTVGAAPLRVTALGVYDSGGDGLASANTVGLWTESGTLLGSVTFSAGTGATLTSNFRWISVTPFDLVSGQTYRIGAFSLNGEDRYSGFVPSGQFTIIGDVTLNGTVRSSDYSAFAYPASTPSSGQAVIGPNAEYSAIPEPATSALLAGAAALGLALLRRNARPHAASPQR